LGDDGEGSRVDSKTFVSAPFAKSLLKLI
jgi:hypothetical protein